MSSYARALSLIKESRYQQALELLDRLADNPDPDENVPLPAIYRQASRCAFYLQNHQRAIDLALKGLDNAVSNGLREEEAECHITLGILYGDVSAYELSISHSAKACEYFRSSAPVRAASALNNIGNVYDSMGEEDKALEYFQSAFLTYGQVPEKDRNYGIILGNLAKIKAAKGELEEALQFHAEAAAIFKELGYYSYQAHSMARRGDILRNSGRLEEAETVLRQAIELLRSEESPLWESEILIKFGAVLIDKAKLEEAQLILEGCKSLIEEREGENNNLAECLELLSRLHEEKQEFPQALAYLKRAVTLQRKLTREQGSARLSRALALMDVERVRLEKELYRLRSLELQHQIILDPLTGLYNRRYLMDQLPGELSRVQRSGEPLGFAFVDIDSFKSINDRFSHKVGDEVLVALAGIFREALRKSDMVIRYGGDEFIFVLPGADEPQVSRVCSKVEAQVVAHDWSAISPELKVQISVGVVASEGDINLDDILHQADERMYRDKNR